VFNWRHIGLTFIEHLDALGYTENFTDVMMFPAHLEFPFDAVICDWQDEGQLQEGDKVSVKPVDGYDDLCGVLVTARYGRKKYWFQLCDLEPLDKSSKNRQIIEDYKKAFADLV